METHHFRARSLDQFKPMEGVGVIMAAMEVYHPMGSYSPSRKMTKRDLRTKGTPVLLQLGGTKQRR